MSEINFGIIGGCGSSGTTLLTNLLGRSASIISGPEFNLFNHEEIYSNNLLSKKNRKLFCNKGISKGYFLTNWFLTERKFYGITPDLVNKWITKSTDSLSFVHFVIEHVLNRFQGEYFIEKTPSNIYFFKDILKMFPDVPIIHVIRDGRDVVSSLMKRGFPLFGAGSRWLYDTVCGLSNRGHENYLEIKYEDLTTDPLGTLTQVFNHLRIPFVSSIINPSCQRGCENTSPEVDYGQHEVGKLWDNRPSDPISTSSIGRYKTSLSEYDLAVLDRVCLKEDIINELNVNLTSFRELLEFLEYPEEKLPDTQKSPGKLYRVVIENADYVRRLKLSWQSGHLTLPRRITYLSK